MKIDQQHKILNIIQQNVVKFRAEPEGDWNPDQRAKALSIFSLGTWCEGRTFAASNEKGKSWIWSFLDNSG